MNVKEKEVTTTQKIYELTEQELKDIKHKEFNDGIKALADYIIYCVQNSRYVFNYGYCMGTISRMFALFRGESNIIENKKDITFQEFINGKR